MTIRDRALVGVLSVALVILSAIVLAPSLGSSGGAATPPPTVDAGPIYVEGVLGSATNASPFGARSAADRQLVALIFRGLVRLGPGGALMPDLAESWETDATGERWTFHLAPDQVWQDGTPITATDVAFTVARLADPLYDGPGAGSWGEVSASVADPLTVVLTLATPLGGFLQAATQPIAPAHLLADVPVEQLSSDPFGQHPIGSAWFRLVDFTAGSAKLAAWTAAEAVGEGGGPGLATPPPTDSLGGATTAPRGLRPYLTGIEFRYFDDEELLLAAWAAGTLEAMSGLPGDRVAEVAAQPGVRIMKYPTSTLLSIVIDLRTGAASLPDPAVRRALLTAIDRGRIVRTILSGFGTVADGPIPAWSAMFDATASARVPYSPAEAIGDLGDAGWKRVDGAWYPKGGNKPIGLEVLSPARDVNPIAWAVADAVVADWRAIGLVATHTTPEAGQVFSDQLRAGDFQLAVAPEVIGLDPDLYPLLASTQAKAGGSNVGGLQDPALDKLLAAARKPGTEEERKAAYSALQIRLAAQMYLLPIAFRDEVIVVRGTLSGPVVRPVGASGDRFWDVLTWRLADGR